MPSAQPSPCATPWQRLGRRSTGTIRTSTRNTFANVASRPGTPRRPPRCEWPSCRQRTRPIATLIWHACPAWSCWWTVATRSTRPWFGPPGLPTWASDAEPMTRHQPGDAGVATAAPVGLAAGRGVWVVVPTYDERENLEGISAAILAALPEAELLI